MTPGPFLPNIVMSRWSYLVYQWLQLGSNKASCIAISGLASHPFGSWQPRGDKSFMWIRDALPSCFSSFRFLTYGYDTTLVNSTSFQSISDLAGRFILDMRSNGWASPTSNRVLFLAHSLGGVLLKQVMVMLANSGAVETFMLGNIMGAVFFGTPSKGMEVSQLLAMTKDQPNQGLVNDLSLDSPYLLNLGLQFDGISELQRMKFFWAYETRQSPTVVASQLPLLNVYSCSQRHISNDMQKSSIDGSFSRSGPLIILVSKDSATNGLYSSQPLSTFQIDDDHSGMVKFSQGDNRTSVVAQSLRDIVDFRQSPLLPTVSGSSSISNAAISKPIALPSSVFAGSFVPSETLSLARSVATSMFSPDGMLSSHLPKGWNGTANPSSTHVSAILRCLQAPERNIRYEQIDPVHSHTFSWVYDKKSIGFTDWLRKGTGIFWISGKPGSGKSTLMKLIHSDHRTAQLLRPWGSQCRKVTATFFFHHRGSALQKSFEGLLRGIISQLIEKEPDLAIPLPIPLRNMLIREYSDRVNHEKLGDLGSDILKLFNRYGLKYDEDADKGIHEILRSLDPRAQLLEVFSGLFDVINDRQYENLERVLLSEQRPLQKSEEDGELDDMVQHLCTTKLRLRYTKTLTNLVKGWLARVNRRAKITWLLQQSGLVITEAIKEDISKCLGKQERRDAIFGETQRKFLTRQTLGEALSRLIRQDRFPLELTLFLDALDEYDGRPEFIAEFLTGIVQTEPSLTRVRVCFASRPWSVFVEEFGQCPGFEIHENTEDDIQAYCIDTMSASTKDSSTLTELVPEIVRRARGVFLWVRLVVQDLNLAMNSLGSQALGGAASVRHEERIGELRIILDSLPDKLSDYYAVILQRIPPSSRWDTYALLECVSRAQWVLDLNMAQMALQCSRSSSFVGSQERVLSRTWLGPNEFLEKVRTLSGGLVEAVGKAENGVYQTLQLMHQTVKEFVEDPEFKHKILGNLASIMFENGNSFLFKAYIVGSSTGMPKLQDADAAGHYATQAEITTGRSQYTFLSDATLTHYCTTGITFRPDRDLRCIMSPLRFAAYYGLHLFLKDTRISDCTRSHPRDTDAPFPALIAALKENYRPEEHVLETAKILLDCNYSPTETHILSLFECPGMLHGFFFFCYLPTGTKEQS